MIYGDDLNFENEVLSYKGIVIVDFYADWCGPCKSFAPIFEEVASETSGVKFMKVNVDESAIARKYRVMSIPTVVLFKNGEVCDKFIGVMQKKDLIDFINKHK